MLSLYCSPLKLQLEKHLLRKNFQSCTYFVSYVHFITRCDNLIPLAKKLQAGFVQCNLIATLNDPSLKKISFRDWTATQQGLQQLMEEMS